MDLALTIKFLRPNEEWILNANSYEELTWLSDTPKPTFSELEEAAPKALKAFTTQEQAKAKVRESALAKLAELGLTEAEINAL
jgi:hypothetical protein